MTTDADRWIALAMEHSRYLTRLLNSRPELLPMLGRSLTQPLQREDMQAFLAAQPLDDSNLLPRLRLLRGWVYAHAMIRDLTGMAPLHEVTTAMTLLAELAVEAAQRVQTSVLAQRHGVLRNAGGETIEMVVVGMGKLGGGELNVSSDIDLIFLYPEDGESDGAKPISAFEYFGKLGRTIIAAIAEVTGDGFVFRVDMRLRPNGDSGPLVASYDMLEQYFISQGREWERYAWIKARAISGEQRCAHEQLAAISRPFVFRKYLDFGAINAMRALHAQIRREVARREMADNIKLGPGGIREIEFIAQVFQLIRGGRDAGLQIRPTLQVLAALEARGLMPGDIVTELSAAYDFLRRLEHRIQYIEDAQTHMIPPGDGDRALLARSMGFARFEEMLVVLDQHRARVSRHFDEVFADPNAEGHVLDEVWSCADDPAALRERLEVLGFADAAQCAERINTFRQGSRYRSMADDGRTRLDALMPRVLELCAARVNADETLARVLDLIEAICRRAAYLALLQQYPNSLSRVVEMASSSSWAATYLTRHPLLLDELLDNRLQEDAPDWSAFAAELAMQLDAQGDDTERQMDLMREAHHAQVFRLLNQDLAGRLTVERLSDHLSALADVMLGETQRQCWKKLTRKHADDAHFAVIGYGKLGGKELGYASDLDIVFIYDDERDDAQSSYARLAQRMNTWLGSQTSAGMLFETDLRLRPNGDAGLLVSSLEAFADYQRNSAWVWEHQALTRARFCAGDPKVGNAFERLRHEVLITPRDVPKLREEVLAMRKKMLDAHGNRWPGGFHVKHDPGGLVDVEFLVQYLVLAYAPTWPELTDNLGNIALLRLAGNIGLIPADTAQHAADAYRRLRRAQHAQRLNQQENVVFDHSLDGAQEAVRKLWQTLFEQSAG